MSQVILTFERIMPSVGCTQILNSTGNVRWSKKLACWCRKSGIRVKGKDNRWIRRKPGERTYSAGAEARDDLGPVRAVRIAVTASASDSCVDKGGRVWCRIPKLCT